MHILPVERGVIDEGDQAVDLGQSPGDIVVLSAADSELAMLAEAWRERARASAGPTLRLANYLQLKHNYSVDLYVEQTLAAAKLIVLRLLGGRSYWTYGVDRILQHAARHGIPVALLPGCPKPDPMLIAASTVPIETAEQLWHTLVEGGPDNAARFLDGLIAIAAGATPALRPETLPAAGIYARRAAGADAAHAVLIFYRALLQAGDLAAIDATMDALQTRGLTATAVYVTSLRDAAAAHVLTDLFAREAPSIVLNTTAFAAGLAEDAAAATGPFGHDAPWLQVILSGQSREAWESGAAGLPPRDVAMHIALPEFDGRIITRAIAFKSDVGRDPLTELRIVRMEPLADRVAFVADLAANWSRLRRTPAVDRKIAVILANYPNGDHRIANAVGLDTPASAVAVLEALLAEGYSVVDAPRDSKALVDALLAGPTNSRVADRTVRATLSFADYRRAFAELPPEIQTSVWSRWGDPNEDHFAVDETFVLPVLPLGNVVVAIQPARGYHVDPKSTYHDAALVPPHGYFAFYFWIRHQFGAGAVIHLGKHGNLEWLPGKALAPSATCYPEAVSGPLPHLYPFIVNDPGEGSQAKRRTAAVIVDHLPPPITRAESYGPLKTLESLIDEYYEAQRLDRRRADLLARRILTEASSLGLEADLGLTPNDPPEDKLVKLDAYLCDLKEMQIRGGLHVFGQSPAGNARTDMLAAILSGHRGPAQADRSLIAALADDLALDLDVQGADRAAPWSGPRPPVLEKLTDEHWRSTGDTIERLQCLAHRLIEGTVRADSTWPATRAVLAETLPTLSKGLATSGPSELGGLIRGLAGRFVAPGPSGAPTRGRPDVLPTGRNFYSLDTRTVPTPAAWEIGQAAAELLLERYFQEHGEWPRALALSAWGTANMRTGGDDIAQALALMGARPIWEPSTRRVTGFEVLPLAKLGRPRVDVTLKVSGFFRDAFPVQIDLIDSVVHAIAARDEPDDENPVAVRVKAEASQLRAEGWTPEQARRRSTYRIFGAAPGTYGAGLGTPVETGTWTDEEDLARTFTDWGQYAYGSDSDGVAARTEFTRRLGAIDAVIHNQDNREHDILDSDDYWQFAGGLALAARVTQGRKLPVYHGDTSTTGRPVIRKLDEELARVVRARAVNPKWIDAMMRHGFKGAFEIAATVDYLTAFAITADVVGDQLFDALYTAYLLDERVRTFLLHANPGALTAIADRLDEAITRGLWSPRSNSVHALLDSLKERAA